MGPQPGGCFKDLSVASRSRGFDVIKGPAALKQGKYWVGYASGNRTCGKRRRTSKRALEDASKLEEVV